MTLEARVADGADGVRWYDQPSGGRLLGEDRQLELEVVQATTVWVASSNSGAGCESRARRAVQVAVDAVDAIPGAVVVSGSGTQCGGTRLLQATGGEGGALYFQGTNAQGTDTAQPTSEVSVPASGTYYFRAKSPEGCWGPSGAATVSIGQLQTRTQRWTATWTGTYAESGALRADEDRIYQGYESDLYGRQMAQAGFDHAAIRALLNQPDVVTVDKLEVYLLCDGVGGGDRVRTWVGLHGNDSRPATYANQLAVAMIADEPFEDDEGRWLLAPEAWLGAFGDGTARGVTLGPAPDNSARYYGRFDGVGRGDPPRLRVTYQVCE